MKSIYDSIIYHLDIFKFVAYQDTIHTVYYAWAMQQLDPEELGEGAPYSTWKLREMQQLGVRALI